MASKIDDFVIGLNLDTAKFNKDINLSNNMISSLAKSLGGLAVGAGAVNMIKKLTLGFMNMNTHLNNTVGMLGANLQKANAYGDVLSLVEGSTEDYVSALQSMNKGLQDAMYGQGALLEASRRYGLQIRADKSAEYNTENLLKQLNAMHQVNSAQALQAAKALGWSDAMVRLYQMPREEMQKLMNESKRLNPVNKKDIELADKFEKELHSLKLTWIGIGKEISRLILPLFIELTSMLKGFSEMLKNTSVQYALLFGGLILGLSKLGKGIKMLSFGFKMLGFSIKSAMWPLLLFIIPLLVLEDLFMYFSGEGESVFGDLAQQFPIFGQMLEALRPIYDIIVQTINNIVEFFQNPSWTSFANIFMPILEGLNKMMYMIIDGIVWALKEAWNWVSGFIVSAFSTMWNGIKNLILDWVYKIPLVDKLLGSRESWNESSPDLNALSKVEGMVAGDTKYNTENNNITQQNTYNITGVKDHENIANQIQTTNADQLQKIKMSVQ